jgi:hypothetical protein
MLPPNTPEKQRYYLAPTRTHLQQRAIVKRKSLLQRLSNHLLVRLLEVFSLVSRLIILDCEAPPLPPLSDPRQFENVFLRRYSQGQPRVMRLYGDSLLRTVTYDVLAELFGNENDSMIMKIMNWAVSNAFYEQIVLHYGLDYLRPELPFADSNRLTVKRGDVLEAYMAGIMMDPSREVGEGYREVRAWFWKIIRLRLRKESSESSRGLSVTLGDRNSLTKFCPVHSQLSELRQSVFGSMKEMIGQLEWTTPIPTADEVIDFWSKVKSDLDGLWTKLLPSGGAQIIVLRYYLVPSN